MIRSNVFNTLLLQHALSPLSRKQPHTAQVNLGKRCNQICKHCHVNASPYRTESMNQDTVDRFLALVDNSHCISTVDITGGAPELHPSFRTIVRHIRATGRHVMDRCNLTILTECGQEDTAEFLASHEVEVIASLPCYGPENVDQQRGNGVFERSIQGLQQLNSLGYGHPDSTLRLNLVYNPQGAFLPPTQTSLEDTYKDILAREYGVIFHHLYTITNMPIARFKHDLMKQGQLASYLRLLQSNFNPQSVDKLMCTELVSVDWKGNLFDCDFNQMLGCTIPENPKTIWDVQDFDQLTDASIATDTHCIACTAGAGSSCGGSLD